MQVDPNDSVYLNTFETICNIITKEILKDEKQKDSLSYRISVVNNITDTDDIKLPQKDSEIFLELLFDILYTLNEYPRQSIKIEIIEPFHTNSYTLVNCSLTYKIIIDIIKMITGTLSIKSYKFLVKESEKCEDLRQTLRDYRKIYSKSFKRVIRDQVSVSLIDKLMGVLDIVYNSGSTLVDITFESDDSTSTTQMVIIKDKQLFVSRTLEFLILKYSEPDFKDVEVSFSIITSKRTSECVGSVKLFVKDSETKAHVVNRLEAYRYTIETDNEDESKPIVFGIDLLYDNEREIVSSEEFIDTVWRETFKEKNLRFVSTTKENDSTFKASERKDYTKKMDENPLLLAMSIALASVDDVEEYISKNSNGKIRKYIFFTDVDSDSVIELRNRRSVTDSTRYMHTMRLFRFGHVVSFNLSEVMALRNDFSERMFEDCKRYIRDVEMQGGFMQRVWYHYCPPGTEIDLDVQISQEDTINEPEGLWLSTTETIDSWDTWRRRNDPKNEPLAEDLKKLFKVTLKESAFIYSGWSRFNPKKLAYDYQGVKFMNPDKVECVCIWDTTCIESVEEIPSPFIEH